MVGPSFWVSLPSRCKRVVVAMMVMMMMVVTRTRGLRLGRWGGGFFIEDALRGRTTARPPLVNGHEFDSQPSCLASGDKHPWRTLEIDKDLV